MMSRMLPGVAQPHPQAPSVSDFLVITNPSAGRGPRSNHAHIATTVLTDAGHHVRVVELRSPHEAADVVAGAVVGGIRHVVAVGGDGTVHHVVNAMVDVETGKPRGDDLVLGILNAGSGGDFVRTFGLDRRPEIAARHLLATTTMPIDLGRVRYHDRHGNEHARLFVNIFEAGWGADVVRRAGRLPRAIGQPRYLLAGIASARSMRRRPVKLQLDHTVRDDEVCAVLVANGQFFGGGMKVAPRALPDDGRFNVQSWGTRPMDVMRELPRVRSGDHLEHPDVREWQSSTATIVPVGPAMAVEADGEWLGVTPAKVDLLHHVLSLSL